MASAGIAATSTSTSFRALAGDANFLPIIAQTKAVPELLEDARARLAVAWPKEDDARKPRTFVTKAIFTPLARVLARVGVTPNMVTVAGTVATGRDRGDLHSAGWIWQGGIALAVVMFGDSVKWTARLPSVDDHGGTRFGAFLDSTLDPPRRRRRV